MSRPLISIILPVYNAERYIANAIQSVIDQSYEQWELLIVNDGSTDATEEIIRQFSDQRIKYFSQSNKGVSAARNVALEQMSGEFFCFIDADDIYPSNSLESRLQLLQANPELHFAEGCVEIFEHTPDNIVSRWCPADKGNVFRKLLHHSYGCGFAATWMIRRDRNHQYAFEEEMTHGEDRFFYISIARHGRYDYTDQTILYYRKAADSAMANLNGVEKGYLQACTLLKTKFDIAEKDLKIFRQGAMKIMVKTFLRNRHIYRAIRSYFRFRLLK